MDVAFSFLFFISLIVGILGLISPSISLFWYKGNRTRKLSSIIFFSIALLAFVGVGFTMPKEAFEKAAAANETAESKDAAPQKSKTDPPAKKANAPVTSTPAAAAPKPKPLTETEIRRALVRNCDTTFDFLNDPNLFTGGDTGYIISSSVDLYVFTEESSGKFKKANWSIQACKQTGPDMFDDDYKVRVPIFQKVRIVKKHVTESRGLWNGYLTVASTGSDKLFIINARNFTLKDINQCNFIQKAKNGIATTAAYIPTDEGSKKPVADYNERIWIDVPKDAIIVVTGYDFYKYWIEATVFDKKTRNIVSRGLFHPATLTEIK